MTAIVPVQPRIPIDLANFRLDLADMPFSFWHMLGQAQSKCEHILKAPLLPDVSKRMQALYLVKGAYATTAIEGNTLTEADVMALYRKELTLPPSREYQGIEVTNIIDYMNRAYVAPLRGPLTVEEVLEMNRSVLDRLEVETHVIPGQYRNISVAVGPYRCPPHEQVEVFMERFVKWYNEFPESYGSIDATSMALIKAIATHLYFVLIHPFGDGNGRTARLLEWRTLDHAQIAGPATHLLSNHYNLTRSKYYENLNRASMGGSLTPFLCYAVEGLRDQLAIQLAEVHEQHASLVFASMVTSKTPGKAREVQARRQKLALAIAASPTPVLPSAMTTISAQLAAEYALTTPKTLARDLTALNAAGLIKKVPGGWSSVQSDMYWLHDRERRITSKPVRLR